MEVDQDALSVLDYEYSDLEDDYEQSIGNKVEKNYFNKTKMNNFMNDDDDSDNDNVNVIINNDVINENKNLQLLLQGNSLFDPTLSNYQICMNFSYNFNDCDLELKNEISKLVKLSINPSTNKSITVLIDNQLILIPIKIKISDRLASYIWPMPKTYEKSELPFIDEFNKLLINGNRHETFAIFGVKYNKTNYIRKQTTTEALNSNNGYNMKKKQCIGGLYRYCDFSAIIVSNNKIVDYAIHGYKSNISEMLRLHQPRRVYYNAQRGDALDVFMNYEYQPFYECTKNILRSVQIYRGSDIFNSLPFCERHDIFCALCNTLRDVRGFINNISVPPTIKIPQYLKNFMPIQTYNSYCQQPTHNSKRLRLKYAKKTGKSKSTNVYNYL